MFEAVTESWQKKFNLSRTASVLLCALLTLGIGIFLEAEPNVGAWMDFISITVVPVGAVLGAFSIYYILGYREIKKELELGRLKPVPGCFGAIGKYVYVPLTVAVLILGFLYHGIG